MSQLEDYIVFIGQENIQHQGLRILVDEAALMQDKQPVFIDSFDTWQQKASMYSQPEGSISTIVLCLTSEMSLPLWLSTLLTTSSLYLGRLVIFLEQRKHDSWVVNFLQRTVPAVVLDEYSTIWRVSDILKGKTSRNFSLKPHRKITFTRMEIDILNGFFHGESVAAQARKLGISHKTVYIHRHNCAKKMGLRNLKMLFAF
ncbi:LuxR C-terminal-related transcriptional regulator [Vagococcus sp. WN89Y]|uniref:LuxR C-terminal-related transcriptional regulator n=1 Tax=Vagococcus sp. WN89Y TaxID=3457258 RepID=UPI003FCCF57A